MQTNFIKTLFRFSSNLQEYSQKYYWYIPNINFLMMMAALGHTILTAYMMMAALGHNTNNIHDDGYLGPQY